MSLSLRRFSFRAMANHCEIQIYDESRIDAKKRLSDSLLKSYESNKNISPQLKIALYSKLIIQQVVDSA